MRLFNRSVCERHPALCATSLIDFADLRRLFRQEPFRSQMKQLMLLSLSTMPPPHHGILPHKLWSSCKTSTPHSTSSGFVRFSLSGIWTSSNLDVNHCRMRMHTFGSSTPECQSCSMTCPKALYQRSSLHSNWSCFTATSTSCRQVHAYHTSTSMLSG